MLQHTLRQSSSVWPVFSRHYANKVIFTAQALVKGARADGQITSDDGNLKLTLGLPKGMGGPGKYTNPEQLFAAGYAACFSGAVGVAAQSQKAKVKSTTINSKVSLVIDDATKKMNVAVVFDIQVEGVDKKTAEQVVKEAHQICPYSNATRGNIDFKYNIVWSQEQTYKLLDIAPNRFGYWKICFASDKNWLC